MNDAGEVERRHRPLRTAQTVVRHVAWMVTAAFAGGALGAGLVEAALVVDFSLAACPTSTDAESNSSYLLSFLVLLLVPIGILVGAVTYRRLRARTWAAFGLLGGGAGLVLYQVLERVMNASCT